MENISLKIKTVSAIRWTATSSVFKVFFGLVQVSVLARFLPASDYGAMAIVTMITGFASVISDFGISNALIQRQEVTLQERSSLYWLNVSASFVPFFIIFISAPFVENFYEIKGLKYVIWTGSTVFVINSFGQQIKIMAEKELIFKPVAIIEMLSAAIGFIVAVLAAVNDMGVYSLVFGAIAGAMASTFMSFIFLMNGWRPLFIFNLKDIKSFIGFGGTLTVNNLVNQLNMSVDLFLSGKLLGVSQLGVYSLPRNFVLQIQFIINPIVTRVGFPLIAKVQNNKLQVRNIFLKTLNMTSSINAPIYVGLYFYSNEFIELFLGAKWAESGSLMAILSLWAGVRSTGNAAGGLIMGMGRADLLLKWNIGMLLIVPAAILFGAQWGTYGVACALLGTVIFSFVPGWYFLIKSLCGATLFEYAMAALRPFVLSVVAIWPTIYVTGCFDSSIVRLTLGVLFSIVAYFTLSYFLNKSWIKSLDAFFKIKF